ncbi:MAG: YtxH domain-containing protein [Bacteroidales bacterium]|nr:YtxH domain-containing protein [Bacteroidales bacterium]
MKASSFFSFLTGALVGAVAAALYFSSDEAEDVRGKIKEAVDDSIQEAKDVAAKAKEKFQEMMADNNLEEEDPFMAEETVVVEKPHHKK